MTPYAFLFPGQGSQYSGMGRALAETFPSARKIFEQADDILHFPLTKLCLEGPEADLKLTENTQPALLTVSVAAFTVLQENGVVPTVVAGHSLGEYSALVAAGALPFADALRLTRQRGRLMQQAVPAGTGAMAALLKLPETELEPVLASAAQGEVVTVANFNSPEQVVIAGHAGAVDRAIDLAKAAGAKRAILLQVSAPFHCPLMQPAQQALGPELEASNFSRASVPVINNWQARQVQDASEMRKGLYEQIPRPVQWTRTMQALSQFGTFVEVGPGTVLAGLLRANLPNSRCLPFHEPSHLAALQL